jgi:hypothetical protein
MLEFTQHQDKPSLRLLVLHDDGQREFDYTSGAEQVLEQAGKRGWTIVSMKTAGPPSSELPGLNPRSPGAGVPAGPSAASCRRTHGGVNDAHHPGSPKTHLGRVILARAADF